MTVQCPVSVKELGGPPVMMDAVEVASGFDSASEAGVAYHPVSSWDVICDNHTAVSRVNQTEADILAQMENIGRNEHLAKVEIAVQAVIFALAVLGNGIVVITLGCRKKKLGRMNLMIIHLSLADLFVAFLNVLPQLIWDVTGTFRGGNFLCKLVTYFQVVGMFASSYVLVTTALDRFLVICHPLASHVWTTAKIHVMVACAWALSFIFSVPQLVIFSYKEIGSTGKFSCIANFEPEWTLQLYVTWITLAIFVIPSAILCVVYGRICYTVWKSTLTKEPSLTHKSSKPARVTLVMNNNNRKFYHSISRQSSSPVTLSSTEKTSHVSGRPSGSTTAQSCCQVPGNGCRPPPSRGPRAAPLQPRAHVRTMARSKVKTIKLTLTVILCYIICWAPFFIFQMWAAWDINAPFEGRAMVIILLLASLNSCSNPWIYMAFSDVLYKLCGRCRRAPGPQTPGGGTLGNSSCTRPNHSCQNRSMLIQDSHNGTTIGMRNLNRAPRSAARGKTGSASDWL